MTKFYDVLIVGGGPAGAHSAYLLARAGQSVLLLEASETAKRKVCGEFLCPRGVQLLESAGISVPVLGASPKVRGIRVFSPAGIALEADFPGEATGRALNRADFDAALLGLAGEAGAEIHRGERAETFRNEVSYWIVRTSIASYRARILIGADGRQSIVSRSLENDLPARAKRVAIHFHHKTPEPTAPYGEMHLLANGGYVGIDPTGEREWNVSLVCDAAFVRAHENPRAALEEALAAAPVLARRLLPLPANEKISVASPISHSVKRVAGKNWALAGDAAGFVDPLTGEGIYQGLLSATLLARELSAPEQSGLGDRPEALRRYESALENELSAKRRLNRAFQWLIRRPRACNWIGRRLARDKRRADIFIGIIGNVYTPLEGAKKLVA